MAYAQAAFVFLIPLILAPRVLFYYDVTPKIALILLAAALGFASAGFRTQAWRTLAATRSGKWFLFAAAGSILAASISAWRSAEPALAWYGSNWRRMGALTECATILAALWIAAEAVSSRRSLLALLRALCAAGFLASLYGIAQYFGWDPLLPRADYYVGEGIYQIVRPPGTLGHSDYFASFLVWPAFAGWALSTIEQPSAYRVLGRISTAAASAAILLSGSRGALLGLACGVAVRVLLRRPAWRRTSSIALAAAVTLAVFYVSPAGERMRARVHWIAGEPLGGARPLLWRDSLKMAARKPLTGYGPDAFSAEFPQFESADLARAYPDFYHESPHNLPLDLLTGEGLLGLLALSGMLAAAIAGAIRARRSNPPAALAFLPGLAAALAAGQFAVWIPPTALFSYLACGVLAGADTNRSASPIPGIWRAGAAAAGVPASVAFALLAFRLLAQDAMLAQVDRRLDLGDLSAAAQGYRSALQLHDLGVSADLYLSRRFSHVAMDQRLPMPKLYFSQLAAGAASRATHQPEQLANAWFNVSVLAAAANDSVRTEYALRAAIAAAPRWYKPHWILARLLAVQGRAEAAGEAQLAIELNNGHDAEVASTLAQALRSLALRSTNLAP